MNSAEVCQYVISLSSAELEDLRKLLSTVSSQDINTTSTANIYNFDALDPKLQTQVRQFMQEMKSFHESVAQDSIRHEVRDRNVCRRYHIDYPDPTKEAFDDSIQAVKHSAALWQILWPLSVKDRREFLKQFSNDNDDKDMGSPSIRGDSLSPAHTNFGSEDDILSLDDDGFSSPVHAKPNRPQKVQNHRRRSRYLLTGKADIISQKRGSLYQNPTPISKFFKK